MHVFPIILLGLTCLQVADSEFVELTKSVPHSAVHHSAGIVVAMDADELLGDALNRSWRCVDETYGNRRVRSRPFSKVNFRLKPQCSNSTAVILLDLAGTSTGETTTTSKSATIVTDSLTRFSAEQYLFLDLYGLNWSRPKIEVKTNQSLNRVKSKKPLGGGLIKTAYNRLPDDVRSRSETFARAQVGKNLEQSMLRLRERINFESAKFAIRRPWVTSFGWNLSSDEKKVYLTSYAKSNDANMATPASGNSPVSISAHQGFVQEKLRLLLAGQKYNAEQIEDFGKRPGGLDSKKTVKPEQKKDWSITFSDDPIRIQFSDECILFRMNIAQFETGDRQLENMSIFSTFEAKVKDHVWTLERENDIKIEGNSTGARQQIVRSIMRKRFEQILPKSFPIPDIVLSENLRRFDIDLKIERIEHSDESLLVTLAQKK